MYIEKSITLDYLYYLKDDTIINKIKKSLNIENDDIMDILISPKVTTIINDFFSSELNLELFLDSMNETFCGFPKPDEIIYDGINSKGRHLNGITFYLKYNLSKEFEIKIENIEQEIKELFKKEFKIRGSFSQDYIHKNRILLNYSGYFKSDYKKNMQIIEYCNKNKYHYEINIKNSETRLKINMVINNE